MAFKDRRRRGRERCPLRWRQKEGAVILTKQALGAFPAGGVLVRGIAFAGVAHGTSTNAASTSAGQSDAQYTSRRA
jgi:hypothetical protein